MSELPSVFITNGISSISKERFMDIKNIHNKPIGGLWASEYKEDSELYSDWIEWCCSQMTSMINKDSVVFSLKDDANILIIDSLDDYLKIRDKYTFTKTFMDETDYHLDFEILSKEYDGVFLTNNGVRECCGAELMFTVGRCLFGWDVSSLLLFNLDCIDKWEYKEIDMERLKSYFRE